MAYVTDECPSEACGAGGRCEDCFGSGAGRDSESTCMTCGGTGAEPPMLPSCPPEGCAVAAVEAGP